MTKKIFHSILLVAGTVLLASLLVNTSGASKKSSCATSWSLPPSPWRKTGRSISLSSPPSATA